MDAAVSSPSPATQKPSPKGFAISDDAAARLKVLLVERQTPEAGLRVAVKGGGCSGLTYSMEWADRPKERDKIFEKEGVRVFLDPKSYLYLMGSELHFEQTLLASGFKLRNPNIKASCGCGESFSV